MKVAVTLSPRDRDVVLFNLDGVAAFLFGMYLSSVYENFTWMRAVPHGRPFSASEESLNK